MQMEISTMVIGKMTKLMVKEVIRTLMVHSTPANGRKTDNMAEGLRHGLMVLSTKETTSKA